MLLTLAACTFGLAWWLGLYLLARDWRKPLLRRSGAGLLAYALALACLALADLADGAAAALLGHLGLPLLFGPAIAWAGALLLLLPAGELRERSNALWARWLLPASLAALALAALTGQLGAIDTPPTPLALGLGLLALLPLGLSLGLLVARRGALRPGGTAGLLAVATLFFGLGAGLLLSPLAPLPRPLLILSLAFDLALLGLAVARFDAFDEGESLGRDMLRSALGAAAAGLLFGGQVAAVAVAVGGPGLPLAALLFSSLAAAIAAQVLSAPLQRLLDRLAFPATPALREARAELREAAEALPRRDEALDIAALDEAEFARLTRRALSHYGDLPRLASSPLTRLAAIDGRLAARGAPDQPLERAAELKAMLAEAIGRLKPRDGRDFGTSDEWRHFNALYFPYVLGLRPYSRRSDPGALDPTARQALEWLATQVPERTLYNWQNAAARLVAAELRAGPETPLIASPREAA